MQEIIDIKQTDDSTKLKLALFEIERLKKENEELRELVDKSKVLHYNDNFTIVKKAKADDTVVYFNNNGKQLPF